MPYFLWSPELSIGIKEIDLQHKSLIQAVNALYDAFQSEEGERDLSWIIHFLANYTVEHFATEEALMERIGYPRFNEHLRLHEELLQQVGAFLAKFNAGTAGISEDLLEFLKQWLLVHIGSEDKTLAKHVRGL
ncbi:MAG: hemerythrin family protein [Holophagaceae bacterium]|nr:hemerythrin family protein [Holophagaceae bacterium]